MDAVLVLYATVEGQSLKVARHAAERLREKGLDARAVAVDQLGPRFALRSFRAALLVAPVHASFHPRAMRRFVRMHRDALAAMPALFLSLSLSQAGVELAGTSAVQRERSAADVQSLIARFCDATGFPAQRVIPIAGCLAYSRYGFFKRLIMKRIARQAGGDTDTSRDHEYTNFARVDAAVDRLCAGLAREPGALDAQPVHLDARSGGPAAHESRG
jgi:menaquinone-dependent protoporphyrinogen oxidase